MHAPVWKRTNPTQIIGLALVLGLVASVALNIAMLARSGDDAAPVSTSQADARLLAKQQRYYDAKTARIEALDAAAGAQYASAALLAQEQRYYDAKMARIEALEAAAGAHALQITALSASQQRYTDLKLDQLNGIAVQPSIAISTGQQNYVNLKADQMDGIGALVDASTTFAASQQRYYDAKMARIEALEAAAGAQYAQAQASSSVASDSLIEVDLFLANQTAALAHKAQLFEAKLDRVDALQTQTGQYAAAVAWGQFMEARNARIDALLALAAPGDAPAATDRSFGHYGHRSTMTP